jgi:hypothetical protein
MVHRGPDYDPEPLAKFLHALLEERNESYRQASLDAGLDHQAVRRYAVKGQRPSQTSVLALADHFGVNPNKMLKLAEYPPMEIFEQVEVDPTSLPAEIRPLVEDLQRIPDPIRRRQLVEAIRVLLAGYLEPLDMTEA